MNKGPQFRGLFYQREAADLTSNPRSRTLELTNNTNHLVVVRVAAALWAALSKSA
ncbi:hypothetical protein SAMN04488030_1771 [Aliiroseovarius halocynthiae]|nr:hypothetical protein SAMN04488030_1771 [Aliiroseovarius halocynthiae]